MSQKLFHSTNESDALKTISLTDALAIIFLITNFSSSSLTFASVAVAAACVFN